MQFCTAEHFCVLSPRLQRRMRVVLFASNAVLPNSYFAILQYFSPSFILLPILPLKLPSQVMALQPAYCLSIVRYEKHRFDRFRKFFECFSRLQFESVKTVSFSVFFIFSWNFYLVIFRMYVYTVNESPQKSSCWSRAFWRRLKLLFGLVSFVRSSWNSYQL